MILQLNHLQGNTAQEVIGTIYSLLEEGQIEQDQFAQLRIQLDWVQYKQNFREVVTATQTTNEQGKNCSPILDVLVDTRQVVPGCLRAEMLRAISRAHAEASGENANQDRLPLEDFQSL